jgi:histidinol-phosphate aminotransferase
MRIQKYILKEQLDSHGIHYIDSVTNFFMIYIGDAAARLTTDLKIHHNISIKNLTDFGWPGYIRMSIGGLQAIKSSVSYIKKYLNNPERMRVGV